MRSGHIHEPRKAEKYCVREVKGGTSSGGGVAVLQAAEIWAGCGPKKDLIFARWGEEEEQPRHKAHYTELRREAVTKIYKRFL